jgi:hypothetical protein
MAVDYLKMTVDTLATLPIEKQEEVYNFTLFLKSISQKGTEKAKIRDGSILSFCSKYIEFDFRQFTWNDYVIFDELSHPLKATSDYKTA